MSWTGRELTGYVYGANTLSFSYDADGLRRTKTVNGVVTEYIYNGTQLLRQTTGTEQMYFIYNQDGMAGIQLNGTTYYYVRNLQGDVTKLVTISGAVVVQYVYDSWGKVKVCDAAGVENTSTSFIGNKNPIRYRGYYYDSETSLYYLGSRYYDPEVGQFISADVVAEGGNLYAYCANDPVNRHDPNGYLSAKWKSRLIKIAIGTALTVAAVAITVATNGAALPVIAEIAKAVVIGGAIEGTIAAVAHRIETGSWEGVVNAINEGMLDGMIDGYMFGSAIALASSICSAIGSTGTAVSNVNYPPNNGFAGKPTKITIDTGTELYRYGGNAGKFVAPKGTPGSAISLPPDKIGMAPRMLTVTSPIRGVKAGKGTFMV